MKLVKLYKIASKHLIISVITMFLFPYTFFSQETYRDNFSTVSYANNNGTQNWAGNWIETNDNNSPNNGFIRITGGDLRLDWLFVNAENIRRTANLTGASSATLSFDWETSGLDGGVNGEELNIQISSDGTNFTDIGSFTGSQTGSFNQDITGFISANTTIRFINNGGCGFCNWENGEFALIDNLEISAVFGPIVSVIDLTVNENVGTATITARLTGGNIPGGFSVDYNTIDNTAFADSDYITSSGTLNFAGNLNETQTFTVPIVNNAFGENDETFFINLSNISNASVRMGNGTITINDDGDPTIPNEVPLTLFDEFNGYYDYAVTAGSFRTSDNNVDPCAIGAASSNTLTTSIPAGSTIEKAYLTWAHSGPSPDDVVTFEGQTVVADVIYSANQLAQYYSMKSDVTSIINGIADPSNETFEITDLSITVNGYCGTIVLGGWSLMIFYTNPSLPAVSINFYDGFNSEQNSSSSYTLDGFFAIGSSGSKTSVLAWEGDVNFTGGETITLTSGVNTTTLNGDGDNTGGTQNVFNSTIYDDTTAPIINDSSQFGVDLDTYDISSLISQGANSATTNVNVGGDIVLLNSVLLKVPSNLMTGTVFEDMNYPGGTGRDLTTSSGVGIEGALVELYDNTDTFIDSDITDSNGDYNIGGMANGTYTLRVVNNTVRSTRGGGTTCTTCIPVQTFRSIFAASTIGSVTDEIGGTNPLNEDVVAGTNTNAQTISTITILNEGAVGIDFGFNFNTIVNTNSSGQGSLGQFIINSNNLDETGLNIEANGIFDPAAGQDTSIFMIPPTGDPLGRAADPNFVTGFFDINLPNVDPLDDITDDSTHIDGRTQTAYSGDTNTGTIGSGGTIVGISGITLPNYNLPEIQVRSDFGDVIQLQASNLVIRNLAVYGGNRRAIRQDSGTGNLVTANLLGVNALGVTGTVGVGSYVDDGFEINGGQVTLDGNYISSNTDFGISVNGGTSTLIQNNHITNNGFRNCEYNIRIANGSGVVIQNNLIDNSAATGIFDNQGNVTITENTITTAGSNSGAGCTELSGINLAQSNSSITNNIIDNNGGAGIVLTGGTTSGNLISQNSIFANGTVADALGIDIASDGVTINDVGDADTGPNGSLNFPLLESVTISGTNLKIIGWSRPGAIIEVFLTDINQGTATVGDNQLGLSLDYGEGQTYLGSGTEGSGADLDNTISLYTNADGNTDNTNRFNISIPLGTTIPVGSLVTSTATISNTTSEFGNRTIVGAATVITNRKITYRVKPN
ncbi:beta strand repeat-containing protein [Aquimarina latercula]|uniref:beta strand repeat-containing protein n=1 Tax=Aquimarina latercula TaxID=987 RepID=UPI000484A9F3|nr:Calx-beta domain-containing protein [Aquimarina latercula]